MIVNIGEHTPETLRKEFVSGKHGDVGAILEIAIAMRKRADDCERDFIVLLRAFELSEMWKEVSIGAFDKYLVKYRLCRPERYAQGVLALAIIEALDLKTIGMTAAKHAARIEDADERSAAVSEMVDVAESDGMPLSSEAAARIAEKHIPPRPHLRSAQAQRIRGLERENAELRRSLDVAQAEIASLREQLRGASDVHVDNQQVTRSAKRKDRDRSQPNA